MSSKYPQVKCTCWRSNKKLRTYTCTSECPKHKKKAKS